MCDIRISAYDLNLGFKMDADVIDVPFGSKTFPEEENSFFSVNQYSPIIEGHFVSPSACIFTEVTDDSFNFYWEWQASQ